jgi:CheY-like chemotaxis protein
VATPGPIDVLLVEDDPGDVVLVRDACAGDERVREIRVAGDGVHALEQLRDPDTPLPDLILLDLNLPRMDGRELLAEIKGDERLGRIPVVVLTTSQAQKDIVRSYELHASAYVSKPVDLANFREVVREIENFFASIVKLPRRAGR